MTTTAANPSRTSHYVNDAFYDALVADYADWQRDEALVSDLGIRDAACRLLHREARLLDQHRYDDWLAMLAPECVYWVPGTPEAGDPRREIAITFEDRRRLEDRIFRLRTGYAWSQAPKSRTVRQITNVEVFKGRSEGVHMLRSNFAISEFWGDETRVLAGSSGYKLVGVPDAWKIESKQVNLIDCDQSIRNMSIVL